MLLAASESHVGMMQRCKCAAGPTCRYPWQRRDTATAGRPAGAPTCGFKPWHGWVQPGEAVDGSPSRPAAHQPPEAPSAPSAPHMRQTGGLDGLLGFEPMLWASLEQPRPVDSPSHLDALLVPAPHRTDPVRAHEALPARLLLTTVQEARSHPGAGRLGCRILRTTVRPPAT